MQPTLPPFENPFPTPLRSFTPTYLNAPTSSTQPAYSSPQSPQPKTPRPESHRPISSHISHSHPNHLSPSPPRSLSLATPPIPPHPPRKPTYLVKIKHQIQLTHIPEKAIQHLDEKMYRLQVRQLIVIGVDADAEEEARVSAVDNF